MMPQNAFFRRTRDLLVSQKTTQNTFFPTLHPLSTVIFATATVLAFILLRDSRFNFHCYTQREATPTQKSVRKCTATSCDILARKITKRIHSSKPASVPSFTFLAMTFIVGQMSFSENVQSYLNMTPCWVG